MTREERVRFVLKDYDLWSEASKILEENRVSLADTCAPHPARHTVRVKDARIALYKLMSAHTDMTWPELGKLWGRHHMTIYKGVYRHTNQNA